MTYSIESIQHSGNSARLIFFWGHQPSRDGSITHACLSQWWKANFEENGLIYKTAEHYMMIKKAELFKDLAVKARMQETDSPAELKQLGRQVNNFDPILWDAHKFNIVKRANMLKFSQNEALKTFLLNTQESVLVEASPVDAIWGIGMAKDHPEAHNPAKWKGQNLLGFALMEVRDELEI